MEFSREREMEFLEAIRRGEETAYRAVYLHYYGLLCSYVLSHGCQRSEAEDVVQEALLRLWTKRGSLRTDGSLNAYLYRMAYHEYIDRYRKDRRLQDQLEAIRHESLQELVEDEEVYRDRLQQVWEAIAELPPKCREIFMLAKQQGLKYKEIAQRLNISIKTVENQMGRALKFIREKVNAKLFTLLFALFRPILKRHSSARST